MSSDLLKIYLFSNNDQLSFSHIDPLVRTVCQKMFLMLTPPGVFKNDVDPKLPILNYGNLHELKKLIAEGVVDRRNVYNQPENLINANSKVAFHKKTSANDFIPKTVFSKEEAIQNLNFPIIAKTDTGSKGEGVEQYKTKEDLERSYKKHQVFCEKFDLKHEFRCLSIKGEVVFIAERIPDNEKAISLREGEDVFDRKSKLDKRSSYEWKVVEMGSNGLPPASEFSKICAKMHFDLGLDFLGVDIGLDSNGKLWCIECNTCPGLNKDQIVLVYEQIFKDFYKRDLAEDTKRDLVEYKKELMRSNADPAKFSFSGHLGKKFYNFADFVDQKTGQRRGERTQDVSFDIEKSFGKPLTQLKKEKMNEDKVLGYDSWLNEYVGQKIDTNASDVLKDVLNNKTSGILLVEPNDGKNKKKFSFSFDFDEDQGSIKDQTASVKFLRKDGKEDVLIIGYDLHYKVDQPKFKGTYDVPADPSEVKIEEVVINDASMFDGNNNETIVDINDDLKTAFTSIILNNME